MKQLSVLLSCILLACSCHPLEAVADKVPLQLVCPEPNVDAAELAIIELMGDPPKTWDKYTELAKHDPAGVACLVLDARDVAQRQLAELRAKGEQATELYKRTEAALDTINDGLKALNLQ